MKKIFISVVIVVIGVCCALILYTPVIDEEYPKDYTSEEYSENIQKNCDIITNELEKIDSPTLKESLSEYQKISDNIELYPTSIGTLEEAEETFVKNDKLKILKEWRANRFINKNYPNAVEFQRQFEEAAVKAKNSGDLSDKFEAETYIYKDGSIIKYSVGGMSVEYAN